MSISEKKIRQIIREESRRVLRESEGGGLKIDEFVWDDIHNDGGSRSQGGELTLKFSAGDMSNMEAMKYIGSYSMSERSLLEDLTDAINDTLEQNELPTVSMDELKGALGSKLGEIMRELEQSDATYQRDAEEADRYSSGGGDFYESRRRRGSLVMRITESQLRKIIKEETGRLMREAGPQRAGDGERAETGSNLNFLLGLVYTYPGMFNMADLRFALKRHRGVGGGPGVRRDFKDRDANRGYYSSMFADPNRIMKYVTFTPPDKTLTLNAAGEERISEMHYPQSIPSQEEFEAEYEDIYYAITDRIGAGEARRLDY